jgi:hypothetical protein
LAVHGNADWTPQRLVWSGVLMAWCEQDQLTERFATVCSTLTEACPHWSLGTSYSGWTEALLREGERLPRLVIQRLRKLQDTLPNARRFGRWNAFAVDGSQATCPRTSENQQAMGDSGKPNGMPLLSLTYILHLGTGLPWDFRVGPGTDSERSHLRQMLDDLPSSGSLLVADAGFVGYDLCRDLLERKQHFLLRVGGNVHLLNSLGYDFEIQGQTAYLWPTAKQDKNEPPLVLRLIVIRDENKQPIYLVTSVLDPADLTDEEAREIYHARWGVEVQFRTVKQTMQHHTLHSRTPETCYLEMTWAVLGTWMLELMTARAVAAAGGDPRRISPAQARNCVRRVLRRQPPCRNSRTELCRALAACRVDDYKRRRPKASRNYPRKKRHELPQPPQIKSPSQTQLRKAHQLTPISIRN